MKTKKFLLIVIALLFISSSSSAQWKLKYAEDEYTEIKIPQLIYVTKNPIGFVRYINDHLEVQFYWTHTDNFDLWWNADMDHNGWISYNSDLDINFIGNSPEEFNLYVSISNFEKSKLYFSFIISDEDNILLQAMKANRTMKIRFYDIVAEKIRIISLPLTGITTLCKKGRF